MTVVEQPGGFEDPHRADGVGLVRRDRVIDRARHRGPGGEVHDRVDPTGCLCERCRIENRAFDQPDINAIQIADRTRRQIVESDHLGDVGAERKSLTDMRTDEAGCTGDEDAHGCRLAM